MPLSFSLLVLGQTLPVAPTAAGKLTLTRELAGDLAADFTDKLSGPLLFQGADFRLLYELDQSTARCTPLALRLLQDGVLRWQGRFSTTDCTFDLARCTASVSPATDDGQRQLSENWGRDYNILSAPAFAAPTTLTANLTELLGAAPGQQPGRGGVRVEFFRINTLDDEADYVGTDGWGVFLRDTSYIGPGSYRQGYTILFRYTLRDQPQVLDQESGTYRPADKSSAGWLIIGGTDDPDSPGYNPAASPPTTDYAKQPEIAGFKTYAIGTYADWYYQGTSAGTRSRPRYGTDLLVLPCGGQPADAGLSNGDYMQVTGLDGANNAETPGCLNLRRRKNQNNGRSVWWRFGAFRFTRCAPLLDVLHYLVRRTAPAICPPAPNDLSGFLSADLNPATGLSGPENEVPRLYVSAGSDVKRPGSSEPATRLLLNLRALLTDLCNAYDLRHFIDPTTGWLRLEHVSDRARLPGAGLPPINVTAATDAVEPLIYAYLQQQLPRHQQLTFSAAQTELPAQGLSFRFAEFTYAGDCVTAREGENTQTRDVSRLCSDLTALLLSGNALPDSCLAILAATPDRAKIQNGNRQLAASELLPRYHRHEAVAATATLSTGDGTPLVPVGMQGLRATRQQEGIIVGCLPLNQLQAGATITTTLSERARLRKVVIDLASGRAALTVELPPLDATLPAPVTESRQFDESFTTQFA